MNGSDFRDSINGVRAIIENVEREGLWETIKLLVFFAFVFFPFINVSVLNGLTDNGLEHNTLIDWFWVVWIVILLIPYSLLTIFATSCLTFCRKLHDLAIWSFVIMIGLHIIFFVLHLSGLVIQINTLSPDLILIVPDGDFSAPIYWFFDQYFHGITLGLLLPYDLHINDWQPGSSAFGYYLIAIGTKSVAAFWTISTFGTAIRIGILRLFQIENSDEEDYED